MLILSIFFLLFAAIFGIVFFRNRKITSAFVLFVIFFSLFGLLKTTSVGLREKSVISQKVEATYELFPVQIGNTNLEYESSSAQLKEFYVMTTDDNQYVCAYQAKQNGNTIISTKVIPIDSVSTVYTLECAPSITVFSTTYRPRMTDFEKWLLTPDFNKLTVTEYELSIPPDSIFESYKEK